MKSKYFAYIGATFYSVYSLMLNSDAPTYDTIWVKCSIWIAASLILHELDKKK